MTEQLYDRSRYRYRHYRQHLEPVIPILRPVIERLGYTRGLTCMDGRSRDVRAGRCAATPMPVPLGELFAIAAEYERAASSTRRSACSATSWPSRPTSRMRCIWPASSPSAWAATPRRWTMMEQAIAHGVDTPLYLRNICEVYRTLGRLDDALAAAQRAAALAPGRSALPAQPRGHPLRAAGTRRCIACAPNGRWRSIPTCPARISSSPRRCCCAASWERGWEEYEWRFRIAGAAPLMPPTDKPQWDGTPFADGTLLLIADQGFGDVIQFSRYIPWAAERCPDIAVACSAEMVPLLRQIHPAARSVPHWERCPPFARLLRAVRPAAAARHAAG